MSVEEILKIEKEYVDLSPKSMSNIEEVDVLIVGSGPTGLGAASRLAMHKHSSWLLLDDAKEPGGLACTDVKDGFLWDMGGHVIFSHYKYFDQLIDAAVGSGPDYWNEMQRVSYVWLKKRWVEYPFQNNLYKLDREDQINCINGVLDASKITTPPQNFDEWIMKVMGEGIANIFMRPYNFKVWAHPTYTMQCQWLGERVATVDAKKVIANILKNEADAGWGPNAVFKFPKEGGTGAIWKKVAKLLPQEKMRQNCKVRHVDAEKHLVTYNVVDPETENVIESKIIRYKKLMSTIHLDTMLQWTGLDKELCTGENDTLNFSSTHVIGVGLRGINPHELKCWLYYPEDDCPFYRCTVFSHYAESNVPPENVKMPTIQLCDGSTEGCSSEQAKPGPYWSLMLEVSESAEFKPVNVDTIVAECVQGLVNTGMVKESDEIVSLYHRRLYKGYPTPHINRDNVINKVLPVLKDRYGIWSRGRFGSWKYEVGNQDHSCMLGVEAADNILFGAKEFTLWHPSLTNQKKNTEMQFEL